MPSQITFVFFFFTLLACATYRRDFECSVLHSPRSDSINGKKKLEKFICIDGAGQPLSFDGHDQPKIIACAFSHTPPVALACQSATCQYK